jgi:hypothetical protein
MRNRREWAIGFLAALVAVSGAASRPGVLEVTYFFLPG